MRTLHDYLLISLFICHFLADFTHLSTSWMLDAKKLGKPLIPILTHALVHALLMFIVISLFFNFEYYKVVNMCFLQFVSHSLIDTWKGRMNGWFPSLQSPANKFHWIIFGFDQLLHIFVIIIMSSYLNI